MNTCPPALPEMAQAPSGDTARAVTAAVEKMGALPLPLLLLLSWRSDCELGV